MTNRKKNLPVMRSPPRGNLPNPSRPTSFPRETHRPPSDHGGRFFLALVGQLFKNRQGRSQRKNQGDHETNHPQSDHP